MSAPPPTDEIVTTEALAILGFRDPSAIARLVYTGKLTPSRKLPGRTGAYMFWRADVVRLAEQRATDRAGRAS